MGSRRLMKQLRKEGFQAGRYRIRFLMKKLGLVVKRKRRFVLTTDSKHSCPIAPNVLDRQFGPECPNPVWATDNYLHLDGLLPCFESPMMYQFGFKYPPEAFHRRIIIAVPFATHGSDHAKLLQ